MSLTNIQREQNLKRKKAAKSRGAARYDASSMLALKSISQVGGDKVKLINISRRGALIESRKRLSPGSTISLRLIIGESVYFIKGRIVRSINSPTAGRVFRSGITFHEDFSALPAHDDKDSAKKIKALVQTVA